MFHIARVAILAVLFAVSPLIAAEAAGKKPNIVLILSDDLGWTDISTGATNLGNGGKYAQTPNIDKLATQGMSFTNMHMYPNCAPTRAALMTGQNSVRNGVYNVGSLHRGKGALQPAAQRDEKILNSAIALAETLKAAGYATGHVGKYHVSKYEDITRHDGFDVNYGGGRQGDGGPKGHFAVNENGEWSFKPREKEMIPFAAPYAKDYIEKNLKPFANGNDPSTLEGTPKHLTDADTDAAIDFMSKHIHSPDANDKPFFINVAFSAVHTAIIPRPDLLAKYQDMKPGDVRQAKPDFAALTEGEDQAVARILKFLDDNGLSENTLVLFTSDNGGSGGGDRNAPLRMSKGTFYEGGLRVPLIARLPNVIEPGTTNDTLLSGVDLYPTFAEFAGAKLPDTVAHPIDGISFAPVLRGEAVESPRDVTYYHFPGYLDHRAIPSSLIIKTVDGKNFKLIYSYEDQHFELYNLTDDLGEKHDLLKQSVTEASRTIATNLRDDLHAWLSTSKPLMPTDPATGKPVPLPITIDEALKAGNVIKREITNGGAGEE